MSDRSAVPWNVVVPILAGVGGFIARPAQKLIEEWLDQKKNKEQLRSALCRELAGNMDQLIKLLEWLEIKTENTIDVSLFIDIFIRTECFQEAMKAPVLFNNLESANHLKALYSSIILFKSGYKEKERKELIDSRRGILDGFASRLKANVFANGEFREVGKEVKYYFLR
jgi:hypothetical protein